MAAQAPEPVAHDTSIRYWPGHNTGNCVPYSVGSLTSHKVIMNKGCEMGPTVHCPYLRRPERLPICNLTKVAPTPQLFKDPEC